MSKRFRKGKKKQYKAGSADSSPVEAAPTRAFTPYLGNAKVKPSNFEALKRELLGPFLFGQNTLHPGSLEKWRGEGVFGADETCLPVFFERDKWEQVRRIVTAIQGSLMLADEDSEFLNIGAMYCRGSPGEKLVEVLAVEMEKKGLPKEQASTIVYSTFACISCHVREFLKRVVLAGEEVVMSPTMADKEKLIAPVKDRGNTNFKQERYKAAIGDYTTAIKLCPYSAILYCNRALCYLKNEEYLYGALDSYRALMLRPGWEKAYYRCAEAWNKLGEQDIAIAINTEGLRECSDTEDLYRQSTELSPLGATKSTTKELSKPSATKASIKKEPTKASVKKEPAKASVKKEPSPKEPAKSSVRKEPNPKEPAKASVKKEPGPKEPAKASVKKEPTKSSANEPNAKEVAKSSTKKDDSKTASFNDFETLSCPLLTNSQLSCSYLRKLGERVELHTYQPSAYFSAAGYNWEKLEPPSLPPAILTTNPDAVHEPMDAEFEEIWCLTSC